jgi:hypothetical protein
MPQTLQAIPLRVCLVNKRCFLLAWRSPCVVPESPHSCPLPFKCDGVCIGATTATVTDPLIRGLSPILVSSEDVLSSCFGGENWQRRGRIELGTMRRTSVPSSAGYSTAGHEIKGQLSRPGDVRINQAGCLLKYWVMMLGIYASLLPTPLLRPNRGFREWKECV